MRSTPLRAIAVGCALAGCQAIAGLDDFTDKADASSEGSAGSSGESSTSGGHGGKSPGDSGGASTTAGGRTGSGSAMATGGSASDTDAQAGDAAPDGPSAGGATGTGGVSGTGGGPLVCSGTTKSCGTFCAKLDATATGCATPDCAPCSTNHATAQCVQGKCAVLACATGFKDCDGDPKNGCEVDLMNDPLNCGSCNNNCRALLHAAPDNQCQSGACVISSRIGCAGGWLSCDNNPANGCEKASDVNGCTDCGEACASGFACKVHPTIALCECTNDAACNWGAAGTCVADPQEPGIMNCHCDALYCGPPGRCGVPSQGQTCKYF